MKVFYRDGKVNFVDENNIVLGYDMNQICCEDADWFISDVIENTKIDEMEHDIEDFVFDTEFFDEIDCPDNDEALIAVFRITNGKQEKYIHLYNCHNGYYSHGFTLSDNKNIIESGSI